MRGLAKYTGACPACSNPIEPGNVIACAACWQLIPAFHRHEIRRWYQARNESALDAAIKRAVPIVRRALKQDAPPALPVANLNAPELAQQPEQ